MALNGNDYPHIAAGGGSAGVRYAYWDGNMWISQTVGSGGSANHASLALDSNDHPHISYYDFNNRDLKYAFWDGAEWLTQTVDAPGVVGLPSSLALDDNDYPHIAYYDESNLTLKYAHWNGSQWLFQSFFIGPTGAYISLALDNNDTPHISYYHPDDSLRYARWDGSQWYLQTVDETAEVGFYNSIAVDNNNLPHISYFDATNQNLKYAYAPTLEIGKDGPMNAAAAAPITYTLEIVNILPITLTNVVITDAMPIGAGYLGGVH